MVHENFSRMVFETVDEHLQNFRNYLVYYINLKFPHKFQSNIYQVAELINIRKLSGLCDRSLGKPYYITAKAALLDVLNMFIKHTVAPDKETPIKNVLDVQSIVPFDSINNSGLISLACMV